jgi:hypothetical protein
LDTKTSQQSFERVNCDIERDQVFFHTCTKDGFPFAVRKTGACLIAVSRTSNFALLLIHVLYIRE